MKELQIKSNEIQGEISNNEDEVANYNAHISNLDSQNEHLHKELNELIKAEHQARATLGTHIGGGARGRVTLKGLFDAGYDHYGYGRRTVYTRASSQGRHSVERVPFERVVRYSSADRTSYSGPSVSQSLRKNRVHLDANRVFNLYNGGAGFWKDATRQRIQEISKRETHHGPYHTTYHYGGGYGDAHYRIFSRHNQDSAFNQIVGLRHAEAAYKRTKDQDVLNAAHGGEKRTEVHVKEEHDVGARPKTGAGLVFTAASEAASIHRKHLGGYDKFGFGN